MLGALESDGVVDVLQSGPGGFVLSYNRGADGWSSPQGVTRIADADAFPDVDLDRPEIYLADMTGDGLEDIVFVASGRVDHWPHLGRGDWGRRVRMTNSPVLPAGFEQSRVFLADLDGDGTSDLVYVDYDRVLYWLNRSGSGWSKPFVVPFVPPPALASLHLVDLLGRMDKHGGSRALPDRLPEWKHLDATARIWGIRHYDAKDAEFDPTSPLGNWATRDRQARMGV